MSVTFKHQEYLREAERGTRPSGMRLISHEITQDDDGYVANLVIGHHKTIEDAEEFIQTLAFMMHNQDGRTTDYDMWSFSCDGDDHFGNSYFLIGPSLYFERYGELGEDPRPFFQLPPSLGFQHDNKNRFMFSGQETDGRQLLLRLGLKEVFLDS